MAISSLSELTALLGVFMLFVPECVFSIRPSSNAVCWSVTADYVKIKVPSTHIHLAGIALSKNRHIGPLLDELVSPKL